MAPLVALVHATLSTILFAAEDRFQGFIQPVLAQVPKFAQYLQYFFDFIQADAPPPTFKRERRSQDWVDRTIYSLSRRFRMFAYYYNLCIERLQSYSVKVMIFAVVVRAVLLVTGAGWIARTALGYLGQSGRLQTHEAMYAKISKDKISKKLLAVLAEGAIGPSVWVLKKLFYGWVQLIFITSAALIAFGLYRLQTLQRKQFDADWSESERDRCCGACQHPCACLCVQRWYNCEVSKSKLE